MNTETLAPQAAPSLGSVCPPAAQTAEQTFARYVREKVEEARHSTKPRIPHETVMARVRAIIERQASALNRREFECNVCD